MKKYSDDPSRDMAEMGLTKFYENDKIEEVLNKCATAEEKQAAFKQLIDSGKINLNVNKGQQDKHIAGTHNYKQQIKKGLLPSVLTSNASELIKRYAGKGVLQYTRKGEWKKQEVFLHNKKIGILKNKREYVKKETKYGKIHYSNKGVHIVPDKGGKEND